MANYLVADTDLTSIANAIRAKGETAASLEFPSGFVSAIQNIPSGGGGGGGAEKKDVNFIDYDGTLLYSYTKAEINAMTSESDLPENPSHPGLVGQGWNWTLAQIKAQLTAMPDEPVIVGQMYTTSSGNTEIDVDFSEFIKMYPLLTVAVNGTVEVDWGDGTQPDTVTGSSLSNTKNVSHIYEDPGEYTISIRSISGQHGIIAASTNPFIKKNGGTTSEHRQYANSIKNIRLSEDCTYIGGYAFYNCSGLNSITLPSSITQIISNAFQYCYQLKSVTIPSGIININNNLCNACYGLKSISIPSSITTIGGYTFQNCYQLRNVTIPSGIVSIGTSAFSSCRSLEPTALPSGLASIAGNAFQNCYGLKAISIPSGISSLGQSTFSGCYCLESVTLPSGLTSIGSSVFASCYGLKSMTIPSGVTAIAGSAFASCYLLENIVMPNGIKSIGNTAFSNCYSLAKITIPSSVTSIGTSAFSDCTGMAEYHFLRETPPKLSNTNAFNNIPGDCVIYVPYSADHSILEAYKTANNWSEYAGYIVEEESA